MAQPDTAWPFCDACQSWHHPDNPTCRLRPTTEKAKGPEAPPAGAQSILDRVGISLQGWPVLRVWRGAVYVRIPRDLQKPTGGCSCQYCVMHPNEVPSWDTLGIPLDGSASGVTWTLHAPEWRAGEKVKP